MRNKKFLNKALALTLAATMSVGCALPAFAAGAATKEETVYVVLNSDGSVKSQTVSDHLHSDNGLTGLTDQSTLTNIQNTQGQATFTQNGTDLTWDTTDTDVYYKGDTTATPPISASISYQLNGNHVTADQLVGQSGHLVINIALANTTVTTAEIGTGDAKQTRTVCTPFAAVVGTMLSDEHFSNVSAEHGIVQNDGGSTIVGFAALPGVKSCVSDLLPSQLSKLTDYMLDTLTIEADVTDCTVPNLMVACAADASLLKQDDGDGLLSELDDLEDLRADMDKLTDAMDQLIDGAQKLNNGATDLNNGARDLYTGTDSLVSGTNTLKNGTATLKDGTVSLRSGADTLNSGAGQLYDGSVSLKEGTGKLRSGSATLRDGADKLNSGLGTLTTGLNTLSTKNDTLNTSAKKLADGVLELVNTALKTSGVISEDMTWATYADVLGDALGVNDAMRAEARDKVAAMVKQSTGTDLTDEQLNCLLYLTAVAMGSDADADLAATLTAQGTKMNQAANDAAGPIKTAQDALTAAGSPLAVDVVYNTMETLATKTILERITANGVDENTAKVVLLLAAQNPGGDGLEADLNAQAANLVAAQRAEAAVQTAQSALTDVGGNPGAVPAVQAVLQATSGMTYADLANQVAAATGVTDAGQIALLCTMACLTVAGNPETEFSAALQDAAAKVQAAQAAQQAMTDAQTTLAAASGNVLAVPVIKSAIDDGGFVTTAYNTVAGATGIEDAATNALLITIACQSGNADFNAALQNSGAMLTNANAVQKAMAAANDSDNAEAQSLIKSFLTGLVTTESADSLKQISDLNDLLSGEQALLAGLKTYTDGVSSAAAGAATAKDGAVQLADGAKTLQDGTVQVDDGANTLKDGLFTLHTGTQNLVSGVATLDDGATKLASGATDLNSGAAKLNDGVRTLYNGTGDLKEGTQTLYEGVNKLNDEGISQLTDSVDLDSLETLKDVATAMKDRQDAYTGYSAAPEGVSTSVKFVMKTAESTGETVASDALTETAPTEKVSLWKRILDLFKFGKK